MRVLIRRAAGIRAWDLSCHILPDGMTVSSGEATAYEPDALVYLW
jgi:hypothetical protein